MFGIGMPELLLILGLALIVLGPKKLPELASALGKGMAEFRRATDELKEEFRQMESDVEDSNQIAAAQDEPLSENPAEPAIATPPLLYPNLRHPKKSEHDRKAMGSSSTPRCPSLPIWPSCARADQECTIAVGLAFSASYAVVEDIFAVLAAPLRRYADAAGLCSSARRSPRHFLPRLKSPSSPRSFLAVAGAALAALAVHRAGLL